MHVFVSSGNFYDFKCVPGNRARIGFQYISPNLTFPCDGVVTKWKIGIKDDNKDQVYLQIWRPDGTDYSRVAETVYTHNNDQAIAEVTTNMTVSAGDVIGFYIPRRAIALRVALAPVPDHTLLQGVRSIQSVSPVATFTDNPTTLSSSPLVSVMFGKCTRLCGACCVCHVMCVIMMYTYYILCACGICLRSTYIDSFYDDQIYTFVFHLHSPRNCAGTKCAWYLYVPTAMPFLGTFQTYLCYFPLLRNSAVTEAHKITVKVSEAIVGESDLPLEGIYQ